jgi:hypothetical protein
VSSSLLRMTMTTTRNSRKYTDSQNIPRLPILVFIVIIKHNVPVINLPIRDREIHNIHQNSSFISDIYNRTSDTMFRDY